MTRFLIWGFASLLLVFQMSCGESPAADSSAKKPAVSELGPEGLPGNHQVHSSNRKLFEQRVNVMCDSLFQGYKRVEMDPLDQLPKFVEASPALFRRYRMKKPIRTAQVAGQVYPRVILKAFRFPEAQVAEQAISHWLNAYESSEDSIVLGRDVSTFKSPPLFCAWVENELFLLQTACIYRHESYSDLRKRFFSFFEEGNPTFLWEVNCEGGQFVYHRGD